MIKKQNLWFLTLFTLILILSVYYITMPGEILVKNEEEKVEKVIADVSESEYLVALEVELEDERSEQKQVLDQIINSNTSTTEEKNDAYLKLKYIDELKGREELLEKAIKTNFSLDSFVKIIEDDNISVTVIKKDHDTKLASEIMKVIEKEFQNDVVISVKFEK